MPVGPSQPIPGPSMGLKASIETQIMSRSRDQAKGHGQIHGAALARGHGESISFKLEIYAKED